MASKRVRVHYRHYHRGSEPATSLPLARAIASALLQRIEEVELNSDVELRTFRDTEHGSIILNGRFSASNGDLYGELVRFDPEANIPLLMQNSASKAELEVRDLVKPNDAEVLRGVTFFLLKGDHVLVIEQDLSNSALERYLRWLICDQTSVADRNVRLPLIPRVFLGDAVETISDVKMMRLKPTPLRVGEFPLVGERDADKLTDIFGILNAANFDTTVIERIMHQHGAALQMNLTVTLKAGRNTLKIDGQEAVSLLRNVPEDDLVVIGEGIRRNRGVLERLSNQVDVERRGNILDRKDAWRALSAAAAAYRDAGLIE